MTDIFWLSCKVSHIVKLATMLIAQYDYGVINSSPDSNSAFNPFYITLNDLETEFACVRNWAQNKGLHRK